MYREVSFYVVDIIIAANKIGRYIKNFKNAQELLHAELEWDEVIRELELIGEAVKKLLDMGILDKKYRVIVDFRNQLIYGYFGIDENIVWEVVKQKLPQFLEDLTRIAKEYPLHEAIEAAKEEYSYSPATLRFLEELRCSTSS